MNEIFFPISYKKALLNKTKNTTIRFGDELGKYTAGKIYSAKSYAGSSWGVKVKIKEIVKTTFDQLEKHGLPPKTTSSIKQKHRVFSNMQMEIIRFEYV